MTQNFPIMTLLVPMLFERKILTNRALTPPTYFRRKCDIGDHMRFYENSRTKDMRLVGIGIVLETAEWNTNQIPLTLEQAKKERSPKKDINWFKFAWVDGFNYYNKTHIYDTLRMTEKQLDLKQYKEFKQQTGKNVIWRGKITKNFLKWKLVAYPNFVDYFTNRVKKIEKETIKLEDFKMFVFKEFKESTLA